MEYSQVAVASQLRESLEEKREHSCIVLEVHGDKCWGKGHLCDYYEVFSALNNECLGTVVVETVPGCNHLGSKWIPANSIDILRHLTPRREWE